MSQTREAPGRKGHGGERRPGRGGSDHRGGGGKALERCPDEVSRGRMQAISAPYNFVPLADWVHLPAWWRQVSHDLPFRDGCSGEIFLRLLADTPLLVGGRQQAATETAPVVVRPFQLPDGRHAIPGSSLKGMLRAVIEIAGFGRMRMVDDARPGLRDISGPHVKESYTAKVRDRVRTGFLRRAPDGGQVIVPCKMVRLDHRDLELALGRRPPMFKARSSVAEKYRDWRGHCQRKGWNPATIDFEVQDGEAKRLGSGPRGVPVFTGQIDGKRRDFVFFDRDEGAAMEVGAAAWRDFLRIHGDEDDKLDMSWPGHWKRVFRDGGEVPVFFLEDGPLLRIGLAYMPKLAGDFSIRNMIEHSSAMHAQEPGQENGLDFADLIFGAINGNDQDDALRGRVSCETLVVVGRAEVHQQRDTILNGPKPSYFPNYVVQQTDGSTGRLQRRQYATYVETQESGLPKIRGFKRYPARPAEMTGTQALNTDQAKNRKVQVRLHTLGQGAEFEGRLVFHNLRPEELGCLLWALTWGGDSRLRHGLGMGKPFGFGQVRALLDHDRSRLAYNNPDHGSAVLTAQLASEFVSTFTQHMEEASRSRGGWRSSAQVLNLLAMADPDSAGNLPAGSELRHMMLMQCQRDERRENLNEFQWAKQAGLVLPDYAVATGRVLGKGQRPSDVSLTKHASVSRMPVLHPWVQKAVREIMDGHNVRREEDVLRGKVLAQRWAAVEDQAVKTEALASIRAFWEAQGWWDDPPPGKAARIARETYSGSD